MLLFQLVQTLTDGELEKLNDITFTPQEHKLFHYCVSIKEKKLFAPTPALNKLQLSATHLYKLTSVVLNKVLVHLYGSDFHAQVVGLAKKIKLVAVIRHLMKIRERLLLKHKDKKELLAFYETCLDFETSNYSSDYDKKRVSNYYKKCLEYAGKAADVQYVFNRDLEILMADVNVIGATGEFRKKNVLHTFQRRFDTMHTTAKQHALYNSAVKALLFNTLLYFNISQPELAMPYLTAATELAQKHDGKITAKHKLEVQMYNSRALYFLSRFDESRKYYEAMNIITPMPASGVLNADIAKFIQVSLITGHYTQAKELLDVVFSRLMDAPNSAGAMARLHRIKYLVYVAKYAEALAELAKLDTLLKNTKVLQYMVEARMLYTIAQQLSGNSDEACNSAEQALKFLYSKKQPEQMADFIEGFQLLKAFAKGAKLNARQQSILDKYQLNAYMQYGALFNRINNS